VELAEAREAAQRQQALQPLVQGSEEQDAELDAFMVSGVIGVRVFIGVSGVRVARSRMLS
jgi:hypothetical protein